MVSLDLEEIGEYVIRTGRTKDQQTETEKIFANDIFIEKQLTKIRYDVETWVSFSFLAKDIASSVRAWRKNIPAATWVALSILLYTTWTAKSDNFNLDVWQVPLTTKKIPLSLGRFLIVIPNLVLAGFGRFHF